MLKIKCVDGPAVEAADVAAMAVKDLKRYTFNVTVDVDGRGTTGTCPYEVAREFVKNFGERDAPAMYRAAIAEREAERVAGIERMVRETYMRVLQVPRSSATTKATRIRQHRARREARDYLSS